MSQDYYQILGVNRDADQDTIKKSYRKLAMQYHPDRNPGNKQAEEKFKEAAAAYEVLSNLEKRAKYDRFGHQAYTQQGNYGGHGGGGGAPFTDINDIFSSFGDIFGDIFGGGQGGQQRRSTRPVRGSDLRYILDLSLEQINDGYEQEIEFESEESCEKCSGSGAETGHGPEVCGTCRGTGQVVRAQGFFSLASTCPTCSGQGQIIKHKCKKCRGQGRVTAHKKIRVKIPLGVRTGTRLRVAGEGEGGYRGGTAGDLYVEIREKEHPKFRRRNDDLYGKVQISYVQALLGASVDVGSLKGQESLDVPPGTSQGVLLKIEGKGLPSLKGYERGDLFYEIEVQVPQKLSAEEDRLLREIAKVRGEKVKDSSFSFFKKK